MTARPVRLSAPWATVLEPVPRSPELQALAAHFLRLQMKKSKKVQTSNWAKPLDERQIQYAANDAWFSRELYLKLEQDGLIPRFE